MTNDTRTPEEIENDIERQRAGLTSTLESLQDKFSVESVARQFTDQFQKHGGDIGQSISEAVKRNPVALALTGVGIAWLMLGDRSAPQPSYDRSIDRSSEREGFGRADRSSWSSDTPRYSGNARSYPARSSTEGLSSGRTDLPSWARGSDDRGMMAKAKDAAGEMADRVSGAAGATGDAASGMTDTLRDAGQSVADGARDMASSVSDRAAAMRDRLSSGTEDLTEEARQTVVAARERAMQARDAAMDYGRQGRDRAMDLFEDQPLIAGALAAAFGAAIGAALPRSQMEDDYMGRESDQLFEEAERIFAEEKEKLTKVAKAATDEVKSIVEETRSDAEGAVEGGSVVDAVTERVKASGQRVIDAAESEADKQNLGDVKKS